MGLREVTEDDLGKMAQAEDQAHGAEPETEVGRIEKRKAGVKPLCVAECFRWL